MTTTEPAESWVPSSSPPTVFVSWAHDANRTITKDAWRAQVLDLATALGRSGIDTQIDLYNLHARGPGWSQWGPRMIDERDITVVAVNAEWKHRYEGSNDPTVGAGAAAEALKLLGRFDRNQTEFRERLVLVVLPGAAPQDVPEVLSGVQHFIVADTSAGSPGFKDLLRCLTGQPQYVPPPPGTVPVLPPATLDAFDRQPDDPIATTAGGSDSGPSPDSGGTPSAPASADVRPGAPPRPDPAPDAQTPPAADIAVLESALRQFPTPAITDGPHLPWFREWERMQRQLQRLRDEVTAGRDAVTSTGGAANRSEVEQQLSGLLESMGGGLVRTNRCWLTLAAVPGGTVEDRDAYQDGAPGARARRVTQVEDWRRRTFPLVAVETHGAVRGAKRVIFPGELQPGISSEHRSTLRRVELYDDGSGVAGVDVAGAPRLVPDTGFVAFPGSPGASVVDAEAYLPVRRVRLEMGLLTLLELLVDHSRCTGGDPLGSVSVLARLELPDQLEVEHTHDLRWRGVRFIDEHRDPGGRSGVVESPVDSRELGPGEDWPLTGPLSRRLVVLLDPPRLVRAAQLLALGLLGYAGVEQTVLLQSDGSVDPAAGSTPHDQRVIRRHADLVGLPIVGSTP